MPSVHRYPLSSSWKPSRRLAWPYPISVRKSASRSTIRLTGTPSRRRSRDAASTSAGTALREASHIAPLPAGIVKL